VRRHPTALVSQDVLAILEPDACGPQTTPTGVLEVVYPNPSEAVREGAFQLLCVAGRCPPPRGSPPWVVQPAERQKYGHISHLLLLTMECALPVSVACQHIADRGNRVPHMERVCRVRQTMRSLLSSAMRKATRYLLSESIQDPTPDLHRPRIRKQEPERCLVLGLATYSPSRLSGEPQCMSPRILPFCTSELPSPC
jgi:hypothetical protein